MSLVDYGRILIRRGWIMILLAVIAAAGAFFLSRQMTPVYRATQTILLVPSRTDNGLTIAATSLLNNHREYLDSSLRAQEVIDQLQLDMTRYELLGMTTITVNQESIAIEIDVDLSGTDEALITGEAARIAQSWGDLLISYRDDLNEQALQTDHVEARRQDEPQVGKVSPNIPINTLVGGVIGFFLGAIIVFVLEYLESNMVRRREDVERLNLNVLAIVPNE